MLFRAVIFCYFACFGIHGLRCFGGLSATLCCSRSCGGSLCHLAAFGLGLFSGVLGQLLCVGGVLLECFGYGRCALLYGVFKPLNSNTISLVISSIRFTPQ